MEAMAERRLTNSYATRKYSHEGTFTKENETKHLKNLPKGERNLQCAKLCYCYYWLYTMFVLSDTSAMGNCLNKSSFEALVLLSLNHRSIDEAKQSTDDRHGKVDMCIVAGERPSPLSLVKDHHHCWRNSRKRIITMTEAKAWTDDPGIETLFQVQKSS